MDKNKILNEFGDKTEELFKHFFRFFKEWVDDFEDLTHRRQKSAAISPRFLDKRASSLIKAFDGLLTDLTEEYIQIALEYQELSLVEKKKETNKRFDNFKKEANEYIHNANVKAEVLLTDFIKSPFKPETEKRLKEIENYTLANLINRIHKSLEE